jgi:hypothetical protein
MNADEYWRKLEKIGWLDFVYDEAKADLRRRLWGQSGECDQRACFALTQYSFDWESVLDEQSYFKLLHDLALFSNRAFRPLDIRCKRSEESSATVSFSHSGKFYSCILSMDTDIVDDAILDIVNQAIADSGRDEQFIDLPRVDQCAYLVLVPPAVYDRAVAEGLIPAENAFEDSDDRDETPKGFAPKFKPSDVRAFLVRQPFQPFRIVAVQWKYDIRHPQLVMVGRSSLIVGIQAPGEKEPLYDRFETISLHNIIEIEPIGAT